jgi:hypothetical protein
MASPPRPWRRARASSLASSSRGAHAAKKAPRVDPFKRCKCSSGARRYSVCSTYRGFVSLNRIALRLTSASRTLPPRSARGDIIVRDPGAIERPRQKVAHGGINFRFSGGTPRASIFTRRRIVETGLRAAHRLGGVRSHAPRAPAHFLRLHQFALMWPTPCKHVEGASLRWHVPAGISFSRGDGGPDRVLGIPVEGRRLHLPAARLEGRGSFGIAHGSEPLRSMWARSVGWAPQKGRRDADFRIMDPSLDKPIPSCVNSTRYTGRLSSGEPGSNPCLRFIIPFLMARPCGISRFASVQNAAPRCVNQAIACVSSVPRAATLTG